VSVTELRVSNYRSIQEMTLPLKRANIITGANGCGKSNLYQSMALLRAAATGNLAKTLVAEGGMPSVLWAGDRHEGVIRIHLGITVDEFQYDVELGLPYNPMSMFALDPHVKKETVTVIEKGKPVVVLDRGNSACTMRNADGNKETYRLTLHHEESALAQISDPKHFPIIDDLRKRIGNWRFYHGFRTDPDSPLRKAQIGVRTFIMAPDGRDLAAALQTIVENGNDLALRDTIADAFPGCQLLIDRSPAGFEISLQVPGMNRPLTAQELSDGQLRYLCLAAALLSPSPAPLIALNEPETSLHQDLLAPLARLCADASSRSQLWLTTHSPKLANELADQISVVPIALEKVDGRTVRAGRDRRVFYSAGENS